MDNGLLPSCSHKLSDAVSDKLAGLRMDSTNPRRRVRAMKGAISPIRDAWNVQGSAAPARTAGHAIETVFVCGLRASEWLVRLVGLERPQWSFGHAPVAKSGVAPAHPGVLPVSKSNPASRATSMLPTTSHHPPGDAKGEAQGDDPVSCTLHPSTLQNVIETLWHPHTSTIKEALETEKVRNKFWPELLRPRILIVFPAAESIPTVSDPSIY
jgi:hypothetical protein